MVMSPVAVTLIMFIGALSGVSLVYVLQCGVNRAVKMRRIQ